MNQIAASILILAASICGHSAMLQSSSDGFGGVMGLVAIGLGLWGAMSLLTTSLQERERALDAESAHLPPIGTTALSGLRSLASSSRAIRSRTDYPLETEPSSILSRPAHLRGQQRNNFAEDALRRPIR